MSGNRFKKMRQFIRSIQPKDTPLCAYAEVDKHQKFYSYAIGTHIPVVEGVHPILSPTGDTHAAVDVSQRVLDKSFRRTYQRLKTDVLRDVRNMRAVDWEARDTVTINRAT